MEEFHLILQIKDRYDNVDTKIMFNANRQLVKDTLIKLHLDENVAFDYSLVVAAQNILISVGALEADLETTKIELENDIELNTQKEILWSLIDEVNTKIKSVRDEQARAKKQQLEKEKLKKEREKLKKQKSKAEKEVELYNKLKQKYEK